MALLRFFTLAVAVLLAAAALPPEAAARRAPGDKAGLRPRSGAGEWQPATRKLRRQGLRHSLRRRQLRIRGGDSLARTRRGQPEPAAKSDVGVLLQVGVRVGFGIEGNADLGAVRFRKGSKRRSGVYAQGGGYLVVGGGTYVFGSNSDLRGKAASVGPVTVHPVHGKVVGGAVVPGLLSLYASTDSGVGFSFSGIPLLGPLFPAVRGNVTFYANHERLAPIGRVIERGTTTLRRWGQALRSRLPFGSGIGDATKLPPPQKEGEGKRRQRAD